MRMDPRQKLFTALLVLSAGFAGCGQHPGQNNAAGLDPEKRLSRSVPPGYRAYNLPLDPSQLVALSPGDRIDLLVDFKRAKQVATILQNVLVSRVVQPSEGRVGTATLLLNPNELQYVALVVRQGSRVWVLIKASGDNEMKPMEGLGFRKLFKQQ
ncbi:MAG: hypothetical protein HZB91_09250 [Elusimicrobia bacterium]|nr:hypothetical protein [Elusimicrobiota bacterium]